MNHVMVEIDIVDPMLEEDEFTSVNQVEVMDDSDMEGRKKRSTKKGKKSPKKVKKSPKKGKKRASVRKFVHAQSPRGCVRQSQKKYRERPSPAFPANECCGRVMTGNDGNRYVSRADKNGVCTWKRT